MKILLKAAQCSEITLSLVTIGLSITIYSVDASAALKIPSSLIRKVPTGNVSIKNVSTRNQAPQQRIRQSPQQRTPSRQSVPPKGANSKQQAPTKLSRSEKQDPEKLGSKSKSSAQSLSKEESARLQQLKSKGQNLAAKKTGLDNKPVPVKAAPAKAVKGDQGNTAKAGKGDQGNTAKAGKGDQGNTAKAGKGDQGNAAKAGKGDQGNAAKAAKGDKSITASSGKVAQGSPGKSGGAQKAGKGDVKEGASAASPRKLTRSEKQELGKLQNREKSGAQPLSKEEKVRLDELKNGPKVAAAEPPPKPLSRKELGVLAKSTGLSKKQLKNPNAVAAHLNQKGVDVLGTDKNGNAVIDPAKARAELAKLKGEATTAQAGGSKLNESVDQAASAPQGGGMDMMTKMMMLQQLSAMVPSIVDAAKPVTPPPTNR